MPPSNGRTTLFGMTPKYVCTDEVICACRALGIDLQKEVHEEISANFGSYAITSDGCRRTRIRTLNIAAFPI